MGNRKKKEGSGSFLAQGAILAAAGIIVKLISLLYRVPITNILGDEGQGYYSIAFEIYALALLLTSYSMPLAVSKLVSARVAKGERKNSWRLSDSASFVGNCWWNCSLYILFWSRFYCSEYFNITIQCISA